MVNFLDKYTINTKGLNDGAHDFSFSVCDNFFAAYKNEEVSKGDLSVAIVLTKETNTLAMDFNIQGIVKVKCDRCLELFDMKIDVEEKLFYKHGDYSIDAGTDTIIIPFTQDKINIAQHIYDFIILGIPLKRIHPEVNGESTCNKEMLSRIENIEEGKKEDNQDIDPRWNKLKQLMTKNN